MKQPVAVLFVCLGNICRSPTAEGVFRARVAAAGLADRVQVDSAGTAAWHIGKPPDARSLRHAAERGIDLSTLRARQVTPTDFLQFDFLLAMDHANHEALLRMAPPTQRHKVSLLLEHAPATGVREVPDPYYGGVDDFRAVLDLVEAAADGLLLKVRERLA
jgi:protein-tyrosine phosphatase